MTSSKSDLSVQYIHDVYSMSAKKPAAASSAKPKRAAPKKAAAKAVAKKVKADPA